MELDVTTLKRELWKKDFRDLFPELKPQIRNFFARPSCGKCIRDIVKGMEGQQTILSDYFGEVFCLYNLLYACNDIHFASLAAFR